jgi:hypothetical protein
MTKEFVPYEQALELKELDYDKPCFGWYHDNILEVDFKIRANEIIKHHELLGRFKGCCLAPTFSQAFRWFREKCNLHNGIYPYYDEYEFQIKDFRLPTNTPINGGLMNYEKAELECLKKLIEIVKNK